VRSELSRVGNEQLLDDLKEGVIILAEDTGVVQFFNKAFRSLEEQLTQTFGERNMVAGEDG